jgi:hypothetical protein
MSTQLRLVDAPVRPVRPLAAPSRRRGELGQWRLDAMRAGSAGRRRRPPACRERPIGRGSRELTTRAQLRPRSRCVVPSPMGDTERARPTGRSCGQGSQGRSGEADLDTPEGIPVQPSTPPRTSKARSGGYDAGLCAFLRGVRERCTPTGRGRSASTPVSRPPRSRTPSTGQTWPPGNGAVGGLRPRDPPG